MKLAGHYNRASIISSLSVLLISAVAYYFIIDRIARNQLDNDLSEELSEVVTYVNSNHQLPKAVDFDEDQTTFQKTTITSFETRFFDNPFIDRKDNKAENGRAVAFLLKFKGENYIVTITESLENTEYLIQIISIITLILTAVFICVLMITNKYILKRLWSPFYGILKQVSNFNIASNQRISGKNTRVDEFRELETAVSKMAEKASSDYRGLKTFTENASHEIMTPLAVITSKLDILIQDETLRPDQYAQITDIYKATGKLSRLNQSLLLLVKIDNDLLQDADKIDINTLILEKIQQFNELIRNKKIELSYSPGSATTEASRYLMDVLINNLLSNAIRHNIENGRILIGLSAGRLMVQNSGAVEPLIQEMIFERFYKGKTSEGIGLGLAVTKTICDKYGFELRYRFIAGMHSFIIKF